MIKDLDYDTMEALGIVNDDMTFNWESIKKLLKSYFKKEAQRFDDGEEAIEYIQACIDCLEEIKEEMEKDI